MNGAILIVDDNELNRELLMQLLSRLGHRAKAVRNGREAVEAVHRLGCGLVLMDVQMPELDGVQATRLIREMERDGRRRVPIVGVSASDATDEEEACRAAGMDGFLSKPVTLDALRATLGRWVSSRAPEGRWESAVADGRMSSRAKAVDLVHLRRLSGELGDHDAVRRLVEAYLTRLPERQAAILEAIEAADRATLRAAAHALRSASAALGVAALADLCGRLERSALSGAVDDADRAEISADWTSRLAAVFAAEIGR